MTVHPAKPALKTEFSDADSSPGLVLWRVTNAWQAAQRAALKPFDLTHVQFVLLASLTWLASDTPVTQALLAHHAGTDPMMTSQVLRALETKALIRRDPHPLDARARALSTTPHGIAVANEANQVVEAVDRQFFGPLSAHQRHDFTDLLNRLNRPPPTSEERVS